MPVVCSNMRCRPACPCRSTCNPVSEDAIKYKTQSSPSTTTVDNKVRSKAVLGLFPCSSFHFDIDNDSETRASESKRSGYDDDLSRMSSSTLSTHTTLKAAKIEKMQDSKLAYGLQMPFPTHPTYSTSGEERPSCTPRNSAVAHGELRNVREESSLSANSQSRYPEDFLEPNSCTQRLKTIKPIPTRSSGFNVRITLSSSQEGSPAAGKSRFYADSAGALSPASRDIPCPMLDPTESSEDSWLNFSFECDENPFHGNSLLKRRAPSSFAPIEKAPPQNLHEGTDKVVSPFPFRPSSTGICRGVENRSVSMRHRAGKNRDTSPSIFMFAWPAAALLSMEQK